MRVFYLSRVLSEKEARIKYKNNSFAGRLKYKYDFKNEETLATALDHELVTKFAKEFMELYNGIYF